MAEIVILAKVLVLVDLAINLSDEVFQRILVLLRIGHALSGRCELLRILLTFLHGWLQLLLLDLVRRVMTSFQVLTIIFIKRRFWCFLGIIGLTGFRSRKVCVARPVLRFGVVLWAADLLLE